MRTRCVVALLLAAQSAAAQQAASVGPVVTSPKERQALVEALTSVIDRSTLKNARVSVDVRSLDDGSAVFSKDADELLNPASNVKLFTTAAALTALGVDYRFDTDFLTDTELDKDGKAKVLYVRGKGDPSITTERLYAITADLVHAGLKEVQDVVVDDGYFDAQREAPGFDQESGDKAYLAPTGAVSLNWNTIGVYLRPGTQVGEKASAEVEPASDYFVVESALSTGTKTQRHYTVKCSLEKDRVRQKLKVEGAVPLDKGTWSVWKKVYSPPLYFGFTLKALLAQRGVKVKGKVKTGETPRAAKLLFVSQSDTLDMILKRLNKNSSNFVAEQLLKTLGAEKKGLPGTSSGGVEVVEDLLANEVGLPRGTFIMRNGSGLNDTNRFSARQTTRLLEHMFRRFPLAPEFLSGLPIGGKDGTLKYRFEGTEAVGRLRAKTGTLENVSALSGYVQAVGGERFVFSIMVNDFAGRAGAVVQHIDALGAAVAAVGTAQGPLAAAAAVTAPPSVVGSLEDVKARLATYRALALKADKANAAFLRTAWRSERDPAVRAIIADANYQSDPREPWSTRMLLDSVQPSEEVWGRLRRAALEAQVDVPVLGALAEIAAAGNVEAIARLVELLRPSLADDVAVGLLGEQLAVVAQDAPNELIAALRLAQPQDREAAVEVLSKALVRAPNAPLLPALKVAQASSEPSFAAFAKELETALAHQLEQLKATPPQPSGPPASAPAAQPGG